MPTHPPRRRRDAVVPSLLVALVALGAVAWVLGREAARARTLVAREDAALAALRRVQEAQLVFRERAGRHGWVDDLAAAGLLAGADLVAEEGRTWLRVDGYRIDVLLPHRRLAPGVVAITLRHEGVEIDPALAARHLALLARPLVPGRTGHRSWYLDERDEVYVHEGVVEDEPLALDLLVPRVALRASQPRDGTSRVLWQRLSQLHVD